MNESVQSARGRELRAALSRRERKKERTRHEIYSAAMRLFLKRGFEAVTIEDICNAADVARGTFFLHFPAKESLLLEYGEQAIADLGAALESHSGSATSALRLALKTLAERARRQPDVLSILVRETFARAPALASHEEQTRTLVHVLAGVIRRGQAEGEFRRKVDPLIGAAALVSAFFSLVYEWARRGGDLNIDGAISQTLDVIINGLGGPKAHRRDGAAGKLRL